MPIFSPSPISLMQSATLGERVVLKIGAPTVFHAFILAIQRAGCKPEFWQF